MATVDVPGGEVARILQTEALAAFLAARLTRQVQRDLAQQGQVARGSAVAHLAGVCVQLGSAAAMPSTSVLSGAFGLM